jgi:hypothetical protein
MTGSQACASFVALGLVAEAVVHFGLSALGASSQWLNLVGVVGMIAICYFVGVVGDHYEH